MNYGNPNYRKFFLVSLQFLLKILEPPVTVTTRTAVYLGIHRRHYSDDRKKPVV